METHHCTNIKITPPLQIYANRNNYGAINHHHQTIRGTDAFSESILLLNVMRVWINELPRATPMNTYFVFKQMALTSKLGQFKINQPKCHMV